MQTEEQSVRGVTSLYLHRGGKFTGILRGYGLHATNDTLFGTRVSKIYRVAQVLPIAAWVLALALLVPSFLIIQETFDPPSLAALILSLVYALPPSVAIFLPRYVIGKRFESFDRRPSDRIARAKDFEVNRDQIFNVEFRWPADLRVGHVLITTNQAPVKIWLIQPRRTLADLRDILVQFCNREPRIEFVEKF